MIKVSIHTYGSVNKVAGWGSKDIKLEQDRATLEDVLRAVNLSEEKTLFDLVAGESGIKDDYTIILNGRPLWNPKDLKSKIENEDMVTAMDMLTAIGGG